MTLPKSIEKYILYNFYYRWQYIEFFIAREIKNIY